MYELTNETVAGQKYYAKLELDDGTILTNYGDNAVGITSISLSSTLCGSESVSIGCVNAASATIVLEAGTALENQQFALYLGQEFDGAVEWVPMGIFTAVKAEISEGKLTVEAWDDLYFAGGTYTPSGSVTGECTVATALDDVCDQLGIQFLQSSVPEDVTIAGMPTGLTCSAAIGHLAALCGANACMDREGYLVFRQFTESGQVLGTDDCYSGGMVFKTSDFTVASLTNTLETETTGDDGETATETTEVERTTGATGGCIALTNHLMTEDNIDTAWDVVKGFAYRPATLTAVGQLAVDTGDVLRVPTLTGGRNYLPNTRTMDGWYKFSSVTLEEDDEGYTVATWAAASALSWSNYIQSRDPIQFSLLRGQTVTLSFDVRSDDFDNSDTSSTNMVRISLALCSGDSTARTLYRDTTLTRSYITTDWVRYTLTATLTDDYFTSGSGTIDDTTRFFVAIFNYSLASLQVRKIKLEIGSTATDWTPAFEDDDESIYLVPVMTHTLEYDGGLKSTITAAGESESQQSAAVSGPVAQQIKELATKVTDTKVLASGKNAVYYAAAAPSADNYTLSVNDLWFDTSGGDYAPHYWNGSEWVDAPFGSDALGEGSVIASKIAAGEVTAEKLNVSELSAITADLGTITGGSLNIGDGTFTVDSEGNLTATGAEISGKITGESIDISTTSGDCAGMSIQTEYDEELDEYVLALRSSRLMSSLGELIISSGGVTVNGVGVNLNGDNVLVNGFRVPEIQRGSVSVTVSASTNTSFEVTFDTAFSGTPCVVFSPRNTTENASSLGYKLLKISSNGFTGVIYDNAARTFVIYWIAVY